MTIVVPATAVTRSALVCVLVYWAVLLVSVHGLPWMPTCGAIVMTWAPFRFAHAPTASPSALMAAGTAVEACKMIAVPIGVPRATSSAYCDPAAIAAPDVSRRITFRAPKRLAHRPTASASALTLVGAAALARATPSVPMPAPTEPRAPSSAYWVPVAMGLPERSTSDTACWPFMPYHALTALPAAE